MAITILRPNQEFTVKANVTRGDTQLVSWIIFSGHNSESMNILQFYPKNGVELNHHFPDEGKFRMAAYHKEIQTKEDFQGSAELKHVDVEIKYNQLDGSKLAPKNSGEFLAGDALRKDFPAVFEAKFLISPPSQEEINRLQFVLEDGSGNILNEGTQASNVFTFIPRNSNAKYTVKAIYTKESGETSQQIFSGVSKAISVRDITHGAEIVRPGTPMSFSVTQTQFGSVSSNSNFPEQGNIKWNLDKVLIGTGRSVTISGNQLMQKKKYHIEAYATSAIGNTKGSNTDNTKNDWHFEVKDNIVENIKVVKKPKFGIEGEFEIGKMTFPNYDAAKDGNISWKITGPENGSGSEAKLRKLFSVPGEYTISCSLGGRECKEPLKINILQPEVTADKCKWIDRDNGSGNIIKEAGINQEVCAFVSGNALDNENLTLTIYDDDSTGRTSVFNMTFQTEDKHKTGFYLPITISQDVVNGIKKSGFADYGDLYFNIVRNGSELQVKNGDKKLGEFLRVSLEPKIINAYFCDANDTQQVFNSPLNGALYFKIYAINLVGRKAEINFITESDAYGSWDNKMKIGPWEDIKNKFKKERIRDTKPGTFNEKGEILVPVDLSKMGKPKNFIRLNAMVKILPDENAKEKQEEKGFYMVYTNLAILFPGATLPTIAENKGAVKVGRENIDGGNHEEDNDCKRCSDPITEVQLKQIYSDCKDDTTLKKLAEALNKYRKIFKLDTCARKAHFFAQSIQEAGHSLVPGLQGETFNYFKNVLLASNTDLKAFRTAEGQRIAGTYARQTKYGDPISEANQIILANFAYGPQYDTGKGFKNKGNDGWNFRGRGLLQITGRSNYEKIQEWIQKLASDSQVDILKRFDSPSQAISKVNGKMTPLEAALTGLADWYKDNMYSAADSTGKKTDDEVVDMIIKIINRYTNSKKERKDHYKKTKVIFEVDKCPKVKPQTQSTEDKDAIWRNPVDNPQITIYTFGGNKRPWRSAFGRVRTDMSGEDNGKRPHHGLDLFATIGTPVYACLPGKIISLSPGGGYGKGFILKVDPNFIDEFKKQKRNYSPYYVKSKRTYNKSEYDIEGYGEFDEYEGIQESTDVYLMYAHLSELDSNLKSNEEITVETYKTRVLGKTGDTGATGTKGPHLHFEIRSKPNPSGYSDRYNPAYYVNYKNETQLSDTERQIQDKTAGKK